MHRSGVNPASAEAHAQRVRIAKGRYVEALIRVGGSIEIANETSPFCFGIARVQNDGHELGSRRVKKPSKEPEFDKVIREAVAELMREGVIFVIEEHGKQFLWLRSKYKDHRKNNGPLPNYGRGDRRRRWRRALAATKAA